VYKKLVILIIVLALTLLFYPRGDKPITCKNITDDRAIQIVKELPEVKEYLKLNFPEENIPVVVIDKSRSTNSLWIVHVFEIVEDNPTEGHTATFNWYALDKCTGNVKCSFVIYDDAGNNIRVSNGDEYPCD
jgi:hypothetical protein